MRDRETLEAAIAAQESLRGQLPDEVIDATIGALRDRLSVRGEARSRRQVTVLFADVSGFTALSEHLDPEVLAGVMNAIWTRLDAVVADFGGHVDKHMGDGLMAVWGGAGAREDDPERAIHAGLALQDALAELRSTSEHDIAMRVGVNTGLVLVGAVGSGTETTVMGDVVNLASRLEHAAPTGGVLVSHDTYRHVRGVFDVVALEPLEVRGKAEKVRTYLVKQAKLRAFRLSGRGVEGVETATIGRDDEVAVLHREFEKTRSGGGSRVVQVIGEAGVGKSRLLWEFQSWLELHPDQVWLLRGRAVPLRQRVALGLLRDVVADRFGVLDSDAVDVVITKLSAGFGEAVGADDAVAVGSWLGFEIAPTGGGSLEPTEIEQLGRASLLRWLERLTATGPAVLLLEDLHWADTESLAVIADIVARLPRACLFVVGLTRSDLAARHPAWAPEALPGASVRLYPLQGADARQLVREVLQRADDVPDSLVELIAERSDGNPFFVEELVMMLADEGALHADGPSGRWRVDPVRLDHVGVPATLTGVLQARLDTLDERERVTVQHAAVVGRIFWDEAVDAMPDPPGTSASSLAVVCRRDFVFRRAGSSFEGSEEYMFKHALLRDVAYETVLLRDRQRLHARVAAWLTRRAGTRLTEYLDMIAEHQRLAGDLAGAADSSYRSGRAALERGQAAAARQLMEQAVDHWTATGIPVPAAALVTLAEACRRLGALAEADGAIREAIAHATSPDERADALYEATRVASERGETDRLRELLDELVALDLQDPIGLTRAQLGLASWEVDHGDLGAAARHAQRALQLADDERLAHDFLRALTILTRIAATSGDLDQADTYAEQGLAAAQQAGRRAAAVDFEHHLALHHHLRADASGSLHDYRAAAAGYQRTIEASLALGDRSGWTIDQLNLAQVLLRLGDPPAARATVRRALAEAVEVGLAWAVMLAVLIEADLLVSEGPPAEGVALLGLVRSLPSAGLWGLQEIDRILQRVALSAEETETAMGAGAKLNLDAVVAALLADRSDP